MDTLTPCHRNPVFTNPRPGTPATTAAIELCATCPIIKQCAQDALKAGDSIDGHVTSPAVDVIAAGVYCRGDHMTAWRLSRIAGVEMPEIRDTTPRNAPPPYCKACEAPMYKWTRDAVPDGYRMHHSRGYCTGCRAAYKAELATVERAGHYDQGRARSRFDKAPELITPEPQQLTLNIA